MSEYQIRNLKSETCRRHSPTELALRRLLHWKVGQTAFATYETATDEKGNFQTVLKISRESQTALGLVRAEFQGRKRSTKKEAEESAAQAFWEHPRVLEKASNLPPSKKARRQKNRCCQHNQKRTALHPDAPWANNGQLQ